MEDILVDGNAFVAERLSMKFQRILNGGNENKNGRRHYPMTWRKEVEWIRYDKWDLRLSFKNQGGDNHG
jgi:hypothetical protein